MIATWGSLGDLHPYLAIACELQRRGHRVLVATNSPYQSKVESLGLEFQALGPSALEGSEPRRIIERATHPWRGSQWLFQEFLDPHLRQSFEELDAACEGADFLMAHAIVLAAPLVAARRKIAWATGVLSPISFWSRTDPPTVALPFDSHAPAAPTLSHLWGQISRPLVMRTTRAWFSHFDTLRAEMGLSTEPHPLFELMLSSNTLALFTRQLGMPQSDWPCGTTQCGAPVLNQQVLEASTGGAWAHWMQAGTAPIVWTLGSTAIHVARDFWRHAFHAARDLHLSHNLRSLFLPGNLDYWRLPLPAPAWGLVADYAPFEALFPRARAIVHPGGVGTTQAAMRAGAPQLIVPWAQDQPDNAARIQARGLGLTIRLSRFDARSAEQAVRTLVDDPKYLERAHSGACAIQADEPNPATTAADAIEAQFGNMTG